MVSLVAAATRRPRRGWALGLVIVGACASPSMSSGPDASAVATEFLVPAGGGELAVRSLQGARLSLRFPASAAGQQVSVTPAPASALGLREGDVSAVLRLTPDGTSFRDPVEVKNDRGDIVGFSVSVDDRGRPARVEPLGLADAGNAMLLRHFSYLVVAPLARDCLSPTRANAPEPASPQGDRFTLGGPCAVDGGPCVAADGGAAVAGMLCRSAEYQHLSMSATRPGPSDLLYVVLLARRPEVGLPGPCAFDDPATGAQGFPSSFGATTPVSLIPVEDGDVTEICRGARARDSAVDATVDAAMDDVLAPDARVAASDLPLIDAGSARLDAPLMDTPSPIDRPLPAPDAVSLDVGAPNDSFDRDDFQGFFDLSTIPFDLGAPEPPDAGFAPPLPDVSLARDAPR